MSDYCQMGPWGISYCEQCEELLVVRADHGHDAIEEEREKHWREHPDCKAKHVAWQAGLPTLADLRGIFITPDGMSPEDYVREMRE